MSEASQIELSDVFAIPRSCSSLHTSGRFQVENLAVSVGVQQLRLAFTICYNGLSVSFSRLVHAAAIA